METGTEAVAEIVPVSTSALEVEVEVEVEAGAETEEPHGAAPRIGRATNQALARSGPRHAAQSQTRARAA